MKLKQKDVITAYVAVVELGKAALPYRKAREVMELRRRLQEEFETVEMRELALAAEVGVEAVNAGQFRTKDPVKREAFRRRLEEQMDEEVEIALPAVDLSEYADTLQLSPNSLEALEGIVRFE